MKGGELQGKALLAVILASSGLSFLLFGYDQGVFGGVLSGQRFLDILGNPGSVMTGLVTGIYDVGCAMGAVLAFLIADKIGRKKSLILANIIVIVGATIQTCVYSIEQMIVARIIAGVGVGLSTVVVPILQSETLPPLNRGALMIVQAFAINFGVAVAAWICLAFLFVNSSAQWRTPIAFQIVFAAGVLILSPWLPETPRWLASQNRWEEARQIQARILKEEENSPVVDKALKEIRDAIEAEDSGRVTWHEVFTQGKNKNLQRVLLGMAPLLFNQWSGVNSITYYLSPILEQYLGFERIPALILSGAVFTQYAFFTAVPYFYLDRFGRRKTIFFSSLGCAICMACIAGSLSTGTKPGAAAATAFIFLFMDSFAMGILPVSWSYSSEIQPLRVRSKASAVGAFGHWMSNFVVVMVTPLGLSSIGYKYYIIWAFVCASFVPIIYFFFVEPSGKTLEEVDRMFLDTPAICQGIAHGGVNARVKKSGIDQSGEKGLASVGNKEKTDEKQSRRRSNGSEETRVENTNASR